jgi:hypothetical protein
MNRFSALKKYSLPIRNHQPAYAVSAVRSSAFPDSDARLSNGNEGKVFQENQCFGIKKKRGPVQK